MSITKPYTFVAGQKARANEVNADFDTLYSQVNANISDIAQLDRDIDLVELTKADVNGNSTQRFAIANPVNPTDGVNKQTLNKSLTNVLNYIDGLIITKDSASPNDTIIVSTGSCYDSTKTVVLQLSNTTTKKNSGQGASTTYYVHIIGNDTGSSIDILISNSRTSPTLPSGYTKFRCIGSFTTDSSNRINKISSYSINLGDVQSYIIKNYSSGDNGYRIWSDGYCEQWGKSSFATGRTPVYITLLKTYRDNNYNVTGSVDYATFDGDVSYNEFGIRVGNTNTIIAFVGRLLNDWKGFHWRTCGYLASGQY